MQYDLFWSVICEKGTLLLYPKLHFLNVEDFQSPYFSCESPNSLIFLVIWFPRLVPFMFCRPYISESMGLDSENISVIFKIFFFVVQLCIYLFVVLSAYCDKNYPYSVYVPCVHVPKKADPVSVIVLVWGCFTI